MELESSDNICEVWGLIHGSPYCFKDAASSLAKSKVSALLHLRSPTLHFRVWVACIGMVVASCGLLEPWFDQLKNKNDTLLIAADKITVMDESPGPGREPGTWQICNMLVG